MNLLGGSPTGINAVQPQQLLHGAEQALSAPCHLNWATNLLELHELASASSNWLELAGIGKRRLWS